MEEEWEAKLAELYVSVGELDKRQREITVSLATADGDERKSLLAERAKIQQELAVVPGQARELRRRWALGNPRFVAQADALGVAEEKEARRRIATGDVGAHVSTAVNSFMAAARGR